MPTPRTSDFFSDTSRVLGFAVLGMIVGLGVISPFAAGWWECYTQESKTYLVMAWSAIAAGVAAYAYLKLRPPGRKLRIDNATLEIPGIGEVSLTIDDTQREAGWRIFVELATRIATQELKPGTGLIREALASLYSLFQLLRTELKAMAAPTVAPGADKGDMQAVALAVLNRAVRPCLSRWHPQLKQWEDQGLPEGLWPLAELCRKDLETTRLVVVTLATQLGQALGVSHAPQLLGSPLAENLPEFVSEDEFARDKQQVELRLDPKRISAAWRIHVQLATRVATRRLDGGTGLISEALTSLHELFTLLRDELSGLDAPPAYAVSGDTLEAIMLRIMNEQLHPFLAKWHRKYEAWSALKDRQDDWPDENACRDELAEMQDCIRHEQTRLERLLGITRDS